MSEIFENSRRHRLIPHLRGGTTNTFLDIVRDANGDIASIADLIVAIVRQQAWSDLIELRYAAGRALGRKYIPAIFDDDQLGFGNFQRKLEETHVQQGQQLNLGWVFYPTTLSVNPDFTKPGGDDSFWGGPQVSIGTIDSNKPVEIIYYKDRLQFTPDREGLDEAVQFNAVIRFGNGKYELDFSLKIQGLGYNFSRAAERGFMAGFLDDPNPEIDLGQSMADEFSFWSNMGRGSSPGVELGQGLAHFPTPPRLKPPPEPPGEETPPEGGEPPTDPGPGDGGNGGPPSGGGTGGGSSGSPPGGPGGGGDDPPANDPREPWDEEPSGPGYSNGIMVWPPYDGSAIRRFLQGNTSLMIKYTLNLRGMLRESRLGAGGKIVQKLF